MIAAHLPALQRIRVPVSASRPYWATANVERVEFDAIAIGNDAGPADVHYLPSSASSAMIAALLALPLHFLTLVLWLVCVMR
jgi:hypothetical protein